MRISSSSCVAILALAAGCAPAPLYLSAGNQKLARGAVTGGEIPRDALGEPVWSAIRQVPMVSPVAQQVAEGDEDPTR